MDSKGSGYWFYTNLCEMKELRMNKYKAFIFIFITTILFIFWGHHIFPPKGAESDPFLNATEFKIANREIILIETYKQFSFFNKNDRKNPILLIAKDVPTQDPAKFLMKEDAFYIEGELNKFKISMIGPELQAVQF